MADFWGGFGKGFAPSFEKAWESGAKRREKKGEVERLAKAARTKSAAAAIKAVTAIKQLGGDPKTLLPFGTDLKEGELMSDWVKDAPNADLLSAAAKATPIVEKLKYDRTRRETANAAQDVTRGQAWTDAFGLLTIPEEHKKDYPKGSLRHDRVVSASGDYTLELSKPSALALRGNAGPANAMLQQIGELTYGAPMPSVAEMTPKSQAYYTSERGMKELEGTVSKIQEYHYYFKKPPSSDVSNFKVRDDLTKKIKKNQENLKKDLLLPVGAEKKLTDKEREDVQMATRELRKELAAVTAKTQFNIINLTAEIEDFKKAKEADEDMDEWVWKAEQGKALTRVADFRNLIQPVVFDNGKGEHQIIVGEGDNEGNLYDKTYFEKVPLPGSKDQFFLDVKPEFRQWLSTYTETIPQFFGLGEDRKEYHTMNPTGIKRSMIYYPPPKEITKPTLPDGGLAGPGKLPGSFGPRDLKTFWNERPEMLGMGKMEREKSRALYRVGPDGNIEALADPKVFKPGGDLKKVPRRGEPRVEVDEAANLWENAKKDAGAATDLAEFFRQATAEEKAAMSAVRGMEERQIAILRRIIERLKGLEK